MVCRRISAFAVGVCLIFEVLGLCSRLQGVVGKIAACACGCPVFSNAYFSGAYALSTAVPSENSLYVYQSQKDGLWSSEKSLRQVVTWNRMQSHTEFGKSPDVKVYAHLLVEKSFVHELSESCLSGYIACAEDGPWILFNRRHNDENISIRQIQQVRCFQWSEILCIFLFLSCSLIVAVNLGVNVLLLAWLVFSFVVFGLLNIGSIYLVPMQVVLIAVTTIAAVLLLISCLRARRQIGVHLFDVVVAVLLFILMSCLALSHFLATPNVAGVVGGKARWLVLNGGFSSEFWSGTGCTRDMLPAYPPCLSMIVAGVNLMAGSSGIWLEQLIGTFQVVLLYLLCCEIFPHSAFYRLIVIMLILCGVGCNVYSALYPDGLMLIVLASGLVMLSKSSDSLVGWVLLGSGAWIKNEGLIFALLITAFLLLQGRVRLTFGAVVALLVVPVGWYALSRGSGATLPDYSLLNFSLVNVLHAIGNVAIASWSQLSMLITVVFASFAYGSSDSEWQRKVLGAACWIGCFIFVISVVYAFGNQNRSVWHVATSAPRLIWCASGVLFFANITTRGIERGEIT